jgi:hypothetical protein
VITLRRRTNVPITEGLRLVVLDVPTEVGPGQTTPLAAYLLVEDAATLPTGDLAPVVELVDGDGVVRTRARRGGLPLAEWRTGDLLIQQVSVTVPVEFVAGDYGLRLSLGDAAGDTQTDPVRAATLRVRTGQ